MKFIDISLPIHNKTLVWPGDPPVRVETRGPGLDDLTLSRLTFGSHVGTHLDAPRHFLPDGKTIDQIPLERFNGPCQVITVNRSSPEITMSDIKPKTILPKSRILFKTKNSELLEKGKFHQDFTYLSQEVAEFLADRQIWLVGIDYLSIEKYNNPGHRVHKLLLQKDVTILEGVYLDHVVKGDYELICLPLSLHGTEGAPCRAVLKKT